MALALVVLTLKLSCIRHVAVFVVVVAVAAVVPVGLRFCRLRCSAACFALLLATLPHDAVFFHFVVVSAYLEGLEAKISTPIFHASIFHVQYRYRYDTGTGTLFFVAWRGTFGFRYISILVVS
jgi:hypothetical protein